MKSHNCCPNGCLNYLDLWQDDSTKEEYMLWLENTLLYEWDNIWVKFPIGGGDGVVIDTCIHCGANLVKPTNKADTI
jgi:hypothetical protein